MLPALRPGQVIVGTSLFKRVVPGKIYIFQHNGIEKIKRAGRVSSQGVYFLGDNPDHSQDSRHFGWIEHDRVVAKLLDFKPGYGGNVRHRKPTKR